MQAIQSMPHSIRSAVEDCNGFPLRTAVIISNMTTPGEIIKAVRSARGLTQSALAKRSGVHLNTLRDIEAKGGDESSKLPFLAEALGLDALSLSKGRRVEVGGLNDIVIPQFDTGGKMGHGLVLKDQPGLIEEWRVSREWLRLNVRGASGPQNLCIVTGFGDSMAPLFRPGDPLIVDLGVREVLYDAVYFFRVGNEGFIKRLQRIPSVNGMRLRVKSENAAYETWEVEPGMDFEVFGRVLKAWVGTEL